MSTDDRRPFLTLVTDETPALPEQYNLCPECADTFVDDEHHRLFAFQLSGAHIGSEITIVEDIVTIVLTADRIEHSAGMVRISDADDPSAPVLVHRLTDVIVPARTPVDDSDDDDRSAA